MTPAGPVPPPDPPPAPGRLRVAIVAANTFEFDSRLARTATALAADGHAVTVVAYAAPGLPAEQELGPRVVVRRVELDRRIADGLRPLPDAVRSTLLRMVGLDPGATALPPRKGGADRLRGPLRRGLEILAALRRTGPWADAVQRAAPSVDVVHAKALIALPVARRVARRRADGRGRYVYDVADLHTESARLVRLPRPVRALIRRREGGWVREASGVIAVTDAMADEVSRRFGVHRPVVALNCPPAWRPETPEAIRTDRLAEAVRGWDERGAAGGSPAIVLYQGAFREDQGIEQLVAALDEPPLATRMLVLACLGFGALEPWLQAEARRRAGRLVVLPPVPDAELPEWTCGADVMFVGAPPRTANQRLTLPNKLFSGMMAGVPVVVAEGTEHCRLTRAEGVGRCCDVESPGAIARAIADLLDAPQAAREALRRHCRQVALERYAWERASAGLVGLYRDLGAGAANGAGDAAASSAGASGQVTAGRGPLRIALLLNNPFQADSRSWKIARSMAAAGCAVTVVARAGPGLAAREQRDGATIVRLEQPRPLAWLPVPGLPPAGQDGRGPGIAGRVRDTVGRAAQAVRYLRLASAWADEIARALPDGADVWQSEGLVTLPVTLGLRRRLGGRVVYDSRDLHLESARFVRLPGPWRRLLARRERSWAHAADAVITANRPYARRLRQTIGRDVEVVFNGPLAFDPPDPPERRFNDRLGLAADTPVVLSVGSVVASRGLEQACQAMGFVPGAVLVIVGAGEARPRIEAEAARLPYADRIRFLDPLPPAELLAWTAAADVALMPIQPSTVNHRLTTPTRLFDAMGAGVPVVASDLPGMAEIVNGTGIGVLVVPEDPAAIAEGVREILDAPPERRAAWRAACLAAARGEYAWDRQAERLLDLYRRLAAD